jgi:O-antigen chain-terminating methyltransferase
VELAVRKLAPGGRLLFETINPESVYAMKWFWMDLTHVRPVPAPALAQLMKASGLRDVTVDFRSPVPGPEALSPAAAADPAFAPIARLLFAPQDYAVSGVK